MKALQDIIKGLESLARAGKAQQESIKLLGSTVHSQAKQIKALEDRVKILEDRMGYELYSPPDDQEGVQ